MEDFEGFDKRVMNLFLLEVKEEVKKYVFVLDLEFLKLNLSGNLMNDYLLFGMLLELFSLNSLFNDVIDLEEFEKECVFEMLLGYMINEFFLMYFILLMLEFFVKNYK